MEACAACGKDAPTNICGRCRAVKYCDRKCQKAHWRNGHKQACYKASNAASGGGGGGGTSEQGTGANSSRSSGSAAAWFREAEKHRKTNGDPRAIEFMRRAVAGGSIDAMIELAGMHIHGKEVPKNLPEARRLMVLAAERGHPRAQVNAGTMFFLGDGGPRDGAEALKWWLRSANSGCRPAQLELSRVFLGIKRDDLPHNITGYEIIPVTPDPHKALDWLRRAAEQGDAEATRNLGTLLSSGNAKWPENCAPLPDNCVLPQNFPEAIMWFRRLATGGKKNFRFCGEDLMAAALVDHDAGNIAAYGFSQQERDILALFKAKSNDGTVNVALEGRLDMLSRMALFTMAHRVENVVAGRSKGFRHIKGPAQRGMASNMLFFARGRPTFNMGMGETIQMTGPEPHFSDEELEALPPSVESAFDLRERANLARRVPLYLAAARHTAALPPCWSNSLALFRMGETLDGEGPQGVQIEPNYNAAVTVYRLCERVESRRDDLWDHMDGQASQLTNLYNATAVALKKAGRYDEAELEYKRSILSTVETKEKLQALQNMINLYMHWSHHENSEAIIDRGIMFYQSIQVAHSAANAGESLNAKERGILAMIAGGLERELLVRAQRHDDVEAVTQRLKEKGMPDHAFPAVPPYAHVVATTSSDTQCAICFEDFAEGQVRHVLPCLHAFHRGCMNFWAQKQMSGPRKLPCATCPMCRQKLGTSSNAAEMTGGNFVNEGATN